MEEILFCPFCGNGLEEDFFYCPFCGAQCRDGECFAEVIDSSFDRLERLHVSHSMERIERIEIQLRELDEELTVFLSVKSPS